MTNALRYESDNASITETNFKSQNKDHGNSFEESPQQLPPEISFRQDFAITNWRVVLAADLCLRPPQRSEPARCAGFAPIFVWILAGKGNTEKSGWLERKVSLISARLVDQVHEQRTRPPTRAETPLTL